MRERARRGQAVEGGFTGRLPNIMSLIQTARACGHDPHAYLRDVLTRLPTQLNSKLGELLPHTWQPTSA